MTIARFQPAITVRWCSKRNRRARGWAGHTRCRRLNAASRTVRPPGGAGNQGPPV